MKMSIKFILFDFDGVIANSFHAAYGVTTMICPHVTEDHYRKRFEGNIHDWEEPAHQHTDECRQDIDFVFEYAKRMKSDVRIFPGMKEVVEKLAKGNTLVIISSAVTGTIREFLKAHGLIDSFSAVLGSDVHASKVEKINLVLGEYGAMPQDCVFITDTLGDMREAAKTNIGSIGVSWGYHKRETLEHGQAFRIVDAPEDLLTAVSEYRHGTK